MTGTWRKKWVEECGHNTETWEWECEKKIGSLDEVMDLCESVCGIGECNDLEDSQFENQDTCDRIGFQFYIIYDISRIVFHR